MFKGVVAFFFLFFSQIVYSQNNDSSVVIAEVKIIGNKTTKNQIVLRELAFVVGDTVKKAELLNFLKSTKDNVMNTSLFTFVTVEPVYYRSNYISIYITVKERWYWWPIPVLEIEETNFNTWWETRDLSRVNYGIYLAKDNFRGRKERLVASVQKGYTEHVGLRYSVPYINKKKTQGIGVSVSYRRNHEINFNTSSNKRDFFKSTKDFVQDEFFTRFSYELRPRLYNKHKAFLQYSKVVVNDSVFFYNADYLPNRANQFLSFSYSFTRDRRNRIGYPTTGYKLGVSFSQNGLGIVNQKLNYLASGFNLSKYWKLSSNWFLSLSTRGLVSFSSPSYYHLGGLGYQNNMVRGYEFYVVHGKHYAILKSQLRYKLLDKVFNVPAIKFEKFNKVPLWIYLGTYFDSGYVDGNSSRNNFLNNNGLYGAGVSLDFVSYYDLVLRTEFSINKMGETGLYIHFIAPI